jgi:DNA-binding CsgD family transcriptional regulator/dipeptidyl aminopeptidase/acylaminoacyl peptidase
MTTRPTGRQRGRPPYPLLTPAEERVLKFIREGETNAEIAARLGVSPDAVKYHVSNMLGKLQLENREQLAAWREPSALNRLWTGITGLGWKLAVGAGAVASSVVAVAIVWGLTRNETEEPAQFDPEALAIGVLTVGIDGKPANGYSTAPSISADGRYIAFESDATNLVPKDTNGHRDIFLIDRLTNETRRVSLGMGGAEANGPSFRPSISADGKWVAFDSQASNLVKDDHNGELDRALSLIPDQIADVMREDAARGGPARIHVGEIAGSDVFVVNLETEDIELVSISSSGERGNLSSHEPSISADGRFVAFASAAPNLQGQPVAKVGPRFGSGIPLKAEIFLRDLKSDQTSLISRRSDGELASFGSGSPVVTADGTHVAFVSSEAELDGVPDHQGDSLFVWSRASNKLRRVPIPPAPPASDGYVFVGSISTPAITQDGRLVAFALWASASARGQSQGVATEGIPIEGVFIHREGDERPTLVQKTEQFGNDGPAGISLDQGDSNLLFQSNFTPPGAIGLYDLASGQVEPVVAPPGIEPWVPVLSGNGECIAAMQFDQNLALTASGLPITQIVVFPR